MTLQRLLVLAAALLVLTACSGSGQDDSATDPATTPSPAGSAAASSEPAAAPGAPGAPASAGLVATQGLVTVIDAGDGPQVCLGPTTMIYPPSCTGPAVLGWSWETTAQGISEQQDGTRWGSYALTGTWDGEALTVENAIPAALYDAVPAELPSELPAPGVRLTQPELDAALAQVQAVSWVLGAYAGEGHVLADVTYDDGSLQSWADQTFGAGVVLVQAQLVDAA